MASQAAGFDFNSLDFNGFGMPQDPSYMKPDEGNTSGFFFADEAIDTTAASFGDDSQQSFDTTLFSSPHETGYPMEQNLTLDNTMGSTAWTSHPNDSLTSFPLTPVQSFDSMYQPQFTALGKRPLQFDLQDFPQSKRHETFSSFPASPSTGSSWAVDTQPTPTSLNETTLSDQAVEVCTMWFNQYAMLPNDLHIDSLSQLTGEPSSSIRRWFGQLLKQGLTGHDSAYKSQTSPSQQDPIFGEMTQQMTTSSMGDHEIQRQQPSIHRGKKSCVPTDDRELLGRDPSKIYQCTRKCGKRYGRKCDWKRNEEEGYPSKSWVCSLCISQGMEKVKPCFRKYHFSQHFRNIHPDIDCSKHEDQSVVVSETAFPRKCGFCPYRFVTRQDRIDHIADHFKNGKCMLDWNEDDSDNNVSDNADDDDRPNGDNFDKGGFDYQPPGRDSQGHPDKDNNGSGGGSGLQQPPGFFEFQFQHFSDGDSRGQSSGANHIKPTHGQAPTKQRQVLATSTDEQHPDHEQSPTHGKQNAAEGGAPDVLARYISESSTAPKKPRPTDVGELTYLSAPSERGKDQILESCHDKLITPLVFAGDMDERSESSDVSSLVTVQNDPVHVIERGDQVRQNSESSSILHNGHARLYQIASLVAQLQELQTPSSQVVPPQGAIAVSTAGLLSRISNLIQSWEPEPSLPPPPIPEGAKASSSTIDVRGKASLEIDQDRHTLISPRSLADTLDTLNQLFVSIKNEDTAQLIRGSAEQTALEYLSRIVQLQLVSDRSNHDVTQKQDLFFPHIINTGSKCKSTHAETTETYRQDDQDVIRPDVEHLTESVTASPSPGPLELTDFSPVDFSSTSPEFRSVQLLGVGGFSVVDEVLHPNTNLRVSRKTLKNRAQAGMEELKKEVNALKKLRHPHIIRFLGAYSKGDKMSILLTPVAETTLSLWLDKSFVEKPAGLTDTIVKMLGCLASSVRYLHEQRPVIKHMDIKPQNILVIQSDQDLPHVVLSDFGVSTSEVVDPDQRSTPLTRQYCAPESSTGVRGQAADIWSLGCVFVEMASTAFGQENQQWLDFRHEFSGRTGNYYWQDVPRLQKWLSAFVSHATTSAEAKVVGTAKSMLNGEPAERPNAALLTMAFTPAPCCLSWANDKASFPGPHEELEKVEMLVLEDGVDCLAQLHSCNEETHREDSKLLAQAKNWLEQCCDHHEDCSRQANGSKTLPTRLLDVQPHGSEGSTVRVVNSSDIDSCEGMVDYVTVSHVWALPDLTLSADREQMMQHELPRTALPKAIDAAISAATRVGYKYVWVDSLCVLQDSEEDKLRECAAMATTYRNAALTIVVDQINHATNEHQAYITGAEQVIAKQAAMSSQLIARSLPEIAFETPGFALDTRAWSLQERLLSRRLLHLGDEQMYWECNSLKASETFPRGLPPLVWEKVHTTSTSSGKLDAAQYGEQANAHRALDRPLNKTKKGGYETGDNMEAVQALLRLQAYGEKVNGDLELEGLLGEDHEMI
ncbi:hypothetical protein BDV95DRAFT_119900 [Massariosphaeria phaeospora]|uniref:Protein kinase domain-containing protein n=1 Tax=Massariosphaeria phaeospora TaxID=100035 RepID=A0A7C8M605_9PLEO|nr:hypothetical protein BDV95DRAFT_119900 [Massariosphaeria phaeospora]